MRTANPEVRHLEEEFYPFRVALEIHKQPGQTIPPPIESRTLLVPPPLPNLLLISKVFWSSEVRSNPHRWRFWVEADSRYLEENGLVQYEQTGRRKIIDEERIKGIERLTVIVTMPHGVYKTKPERNLFSLGIIVFRYFTLIEGAGEEPILTVDPLNDKGLKSIKQKFTLEL